MMVRKKQHIVPYGNQWAIRAEGNIRVSSVYQTKKEAITVARKRMHCKSSDLIIHYGSGKIIKKGDES